MAYAIEKRPGQWVARFRGFLKVGRAGKCQVVIPRERLRPGHAEADAKAYAEDCDRTCRLLEVTRTIATIERARALKAISDVQAAALLARQPMPQTPGATASLAPLTVMEAARMHPSSRRETIADPGAAVRHERELLAFCTWGQVANLANVTLDQVSLYVAKLTADGLSWDGRRHALLWLRRATRMGATRGLPDVLGKLKLDSRPPALRAVALSYWTLPELARACVRTDDARLRAVIGLGGFVGLRPSEVFSIDIPDLIASEDLLHTGAKNEQSRRIIPLPPFLTAWLREVAGKRTTGRLITTHGRWGHGETDNAKRGDFTQASFGHWFMPLMVAAGAKDLPPKFLRKSFATWAFRSPELPAQHVEAFLGHKTALASIVTGRHYLAELVARELRPTAAAIERLVGAALERARLDARSGSPADRPGVPAGGTDAQVAS